MKLFLITTWIVALQALPQLPAGCDGGMCGTGESEYSGYPPRRTDMNQTPPTQSTAGCNTQSSCDDVSRSGPAPYPASGVRQMDSSLMEDQFDGYPNKVSPASFQPTNELDSRHEPEMNVDLTDDINSGSTGRKDVQIHRHIYFHTAPPEPEAEQQQQMMAAATRRKHYTIIFIHASKFSEPAQPQQQVAVPQNEVKTIVYVLVKKPDDQNQAGTPTGPTAPPNRPEVYFIKYKEQRKSKPTISDDAVDQRHEEDKAPYPAKEDSGPKHRRHTYFN